MSDSDDEEFNILFESNCCNVKKEKLDKDEVQIPQNIVINQMALYLERIKVFQCEQCSTICESKKRLKIHQKTHLSTKIKFSCDLCTKTYFHKAVLSRHIINDHLNDKNKLFKIRMFFEVAPQSRTIKFSCDLCKKSFFKKTELATHLKSHKTKKRQSNQKIDAESKRCRYCKKKICCDKGIDRHEGKKIENR
jgi:hypothetical protein